MVLYKYLNCAVDKTMEAGHTAITDCSYLLINDATYYFLVQAFDKRPSREICTYVT